METKKMYEQPKFEEVKIATNQILCNSGGGEGNHAPELRDPEF